MYLVFVAAINILFELVIGAVTTNIYFSETNYTMCETTLPYVNIIKGKCSYSCSRMKTIGSSNGQNFVCSKDGTHPVSCINGNCEIGECEIVLCEKDDLSDSDCIQKRKYSRTRMCVVFRALISDRIVKAKATQDDGYSKSNFNVIDAVLFAIALAGVIILRYTIKRVCKRHLSNQANNYAAQVQTIESPINNRDSYIPVPTNAVNLNETPPPKYNEIIHSNHDETPPPSYKEAIELQMIASTCTTVR